MSDGETRHGSAVSAEKNRRAPNSDGFPCDMDVQRSRETMAAKHRSFVTGLVFDLHGNEAFRQIGQRGKGGVGRGVDVRLGVLIFVVAQKRSAGGRVALVNRDTRKAADDRGGAPSPAAPVVSGYGYSLTGGRSAGLDRPLRIAGFNDWGATVNPQEGIPGIPGLIERVKINPAIGQMGKNVEPGVRGAKDKTTDD